MNYLSCHHYRGLFRISSNKYLCAEDNLFFLFKMNIIHYKKRTGVRFIFIFVNQYSTFLPPVQHSGLRSGQPE